MSTNGLAQLTISALYKTQEVQRAGREMNTKIC